MNWKGRNEKGTGLKTLQEKKEKTNKKQNKKTKKKEEKKRRRVKWTELKLLSLTIKVFGFEFSFLSAKGVGQFMAGNLVQQTSSFSKIYILHQMETFSWLIYVMSPPKPPHFSESILPPQMWSFRDSAVDGDQLSVTTSSCFSGDWCQHRLVSPANVIKQQSMSLAVSSLSLHIITYRIGNLA